MDILNERYVPPAAPSEAKNLYAVDGLCHNAEPGTYGHECGKPATWLGRRAGGDWSGYCDDCKANGYEARECRAWTPHPRLTAT